MIKKKLVRSRDVVFIKDQTIDNIEKAEKKVFSGSEGLVDLNPVLMVNLPNPVDNGIQGDNQTDGQLRTDDVPTDDIGNDDEVVEQGWQPPSERESSNLLPGTLVQSTSFLLMRGTQIALMKFKLIRIKSSR